MKKYLLIGFIIGFIIGPIVVVEGFGTYTRYRIAKMDLAEHQRVIEAQKKWALTKPSTPPKNFTGTP
jgi:hypothetical protein